MYTLAVVNQKGGVGKTTTAVTVAHGLAMRGLDVLLVDLDPQGNVADCLGMEREPDLYELLVGEPSGLRPDSGSGDPSGTWKRGRSSGRDGLDVALSDKRTSVARQILTGRAFREEALARKLRPMEELYSVCVLDAAPRLDLLQICALVAADGFLVPVKLDYLAAAGARRTLESVDALRELGSEHGRFLGIVPTFWDRQTNESDYQLRWLVDQFRELVWPPVPTDCKVREAPAHGETLWEYAVSTPALDGRLIDGERRGGYLQVVARLLREMNGNVWDAIGDRAMG
jgi:chromosome partitioning protein